MNLDFYGTRFSHVYVNNNGNLTTTSGMSTYTPSATLETGYANYGAIIAPFFADVDTRNGNGTVTYAATTVGGRPAWEADWNNVGYYNQHGDLRNTFSVTLVDRSDLLPVISTLFLPTAASNGTPATPAMAKMALRAVTAYPARAGYSNGSGEDDTYYELPGSGTPDGLLGLSGAYTCQIRNPSVGLTAHRTGDNYSEAVSADDQTLRRSVELRDPRGRQHRSGTGWNDDRHRVQYGLDLAGNAHQPFRPRSGENHLDATPVASGANPRRHGQRRSVERELGRRFSTPRAICSPAGLSRQRLAARAIWRAWPARRGCIRRRSPGRPRFLAHVQLRRCPRADRSLSLHPYHHRQISMLDIDGSALSSIGVNGDLLQASATE